MTNGELAAMAALVAKQIDKNLRENVAGDIVDCIYGFAAGAVAASLVPIPGLDVALATADIWIMYMRINKHLGISFSENLMKSVGSAIIANLTANLGQIIVAGALKFIPVIGSGLGGIIMSASIFGTTIAAGWVYLKALTKFYGNGQKGDLRSIVKDVLSNDQEEIQLVLDEGKKSYRK